MEVIVVFWNNSDNFSVVILRDKSRTVKDQVRQWEREHTNSTEQHFGIVQEVEVQED